MIRATFAALVCLACLAACSPGQQQRAQSDMNDAFIAAQIKTKIAAIDAATVSLVKVDVDKRVVTLSGEVHSVSERDKVDAAARSVSGVTRVADRLTVNVKAPTAQEITDDLSLQARVQTALAAQTGVNALKVQVSVHSGVVQLEGTFASRALHEVILETVRGVPGVRHIVDRLHLAAPGTRASR